MEAEPDPHLQAFWAYLAGDPTPARAAAEEGRDLANAIRDRFNSPQCRLCLGWAQWIQGDLEGAVAQSGKLSADAEVAHDVANQVNGLVRMALALAYRGETSAARAAAGAALDASAELGGIFAGFAHITLAHAALAAARVTF